LRTHSFPTQMRRAATRSGGSALAAALCLSAALWLVPAATASAAWMHPTRLSEVAHNATSPEVVVSAHGTAMAIWGAQGEGANLVQVSERPASSGVWQAAVTLSTPGEDAQSGQVAIAPDGEAIAVWEQLNGNFQGGNFVVQSSVKAPGGSWGPPVALSSPNGEDSEPQVAINAAGEAVVIWDSYRHHSVEDAIVLQGSSRPSAGAEWEAPVDISEQNHGASNPQLALNEEGEALAAWHQSALSTQAVQVAVRPSKAGWGAPITLSGASHAAEPSIALNNNGAAAVTWASLDESGHELIEASSRPAANGEWVPATLAEGETSRRGFQFARPAIGIDATGVATATWPLISNSNDFVQAATMNSDGSWQPPTTLEETGFEGSDPHLAMNLQGEAVAIWTARVGGERSARTSSLSDPMATWSQPQTLSAPGVFVFEPAIAIDPNGGAFSIWSSTQNNENVVESATFIRPGSSEVTITTSKTRALLGEAVTLKAKIAPTPEDPHPGTVRFVLANELEVAPSECEAMVNASTGEASCEIAETATAEFEWIAEYSGSEDTTFPAATSAPLKMEWAPPSPCASGYYSTTGLEPCTEANPGSYVGENGATSETLCSAGTFQANSHSEGCDPAGLGNFVAGEGATAEQECPAGYYAETTGRNTCLEAAAGHYDAGTGNATATPCAAGTYDSEAGSTSSAACQSAPAGAFSSEGATEPTPCAAGTYNPNAGAASSEACVLAPGGTYSGEDAAEPTDCAAGTYNPNTGATSVAACEPAPAGSSTTEGAEVPTPCMAGTYASETGSTGCESAALGNFVALSGSTEEQPCPAGRYASTSGATSCTITPANTYSAAGASEPTPCPLETESATGASSCVAVAHTHESEPEAEPKSAPTPTPYPKVEPTPAPTHAPARSAVPEPAPIITNASVNHRCVASFALAIQTIAKRLVLSYDVNEAATISYTVSRRDGSPQWTSCPTAKGTKSYAYQPLWTGAEKASAAAHSNSTQAPQVAPEESLDSKRTAQLTRAIAAAGVNAKRLKPGTYLLAIVATNGEGRQSRLASVKFWVVGAFKPGHKALHR
jgi:hypothetical protein